MRHHARFVFSDSFMKRNNITNRRQFLGRSIAASAAASMARMSAADAGGSLRAGAATSNITPGLGSSLAGDMTDIIAAEIHDELHVRALVLESGSVRLALVACDLCVLPREPIDRAKELIQRHAGIPPSNILIAAVHTHSAPPAYHLFQSQPDPKYVDFLVTRIADAVRCAVNRLEPARIGWGVGREDRVIFYRRYFMKPGTIPPDPFGRTTDTVKMNPGIGNPNVIRPAGQVDPDVGVLAIEAAGGRPISVVATYALHYVGDVVDGHVSADYFGAWANSLAALAKAPECGAYPPFVPILFNGCSGNINNWDVMGGAGGKGGKPYEKIRRVADMLAAECFRTWRNMEMRASAGLAVSQEEIELAVRLPSAGDIAAARKTLAAAPKTGPYTEWPHIYARETIIMSETFPRTVRLPVQAMRIGGLAFVGFPSEAFVELGREIKAKSPIQPTFIAELANAYHGYVPHLEGFDQGGYETWRAKSSYLEREAGPKLVAAVMRRLEALR